MRKGPTGDGAAPEIDITVLGRLTQIGKGGQGRVHTTDAVRINREWPVVFKEYEPSVLAQLDVGQLRRMVAFVPQLDAETGRWLCERAAWPAALVTRGPAVCGFLMRRIPEDFEFAPSGAVRRPAGFQFLLNPDDYLARIAVPIDDEGRLRLLADLAGTLTRLHRLGVVVGDLSPNNLLFHLGDQPRCFFIDCDAMRLRGGSVLDQTETPDWEVPRAGGEPLATPATDAYKFGLLAVRLFARDQSSRDPSVLSAVSTELAQLARRSLAVDPADRPSPAEWMAALAAATAVCDGGAPGPAPVASSRPAPATSAATATGKPVPGVGTVLVTLALIVFVVYLCSEYW
ncbi:lipopolysaccharide kinase InaA family protein [Micromonospora sp. DT233]|uniref:lipopolysaccharide kinase InaA family protein n=1 Tax=Micromonospora sp. DT233 TaxID=3393432 RepID=UPI003CED494B